MKSSTKEADFKCVDEVASSLLLWMRQDEARPDLDAQYTEKGETGKHRYFVFPYSWPEKSWGPQFENASFAAFPARIQEHISGQKMSNFMGILPEINRVWITVDNKLFLWNYLYPQEYFEYDSLNEVIMSVTLSAPKPGVFVDSVKYVIVVATTIEVVLLAVTISAEGALRIVPTAYNISTDNVTVYKLLGSQSGRIFMGGHDGNLYELTYDCPESNWSAMLGIETGSSHKCRKINHTSWNWKKVLPPIVRSWIENVNESIVDMCIDDARRLLYCVTSSNRIRVVYLGKRFDTTTLIPDDFDLFTEVTSFCTSERRGYSVREAAPDAGIFVEEESVAVAGVFVVPITESRKVNLMIVLQNGFRVCLRLVDSSFSSGFSSAVASNISNLENPESASSLRLAIVYIRGPPQPEVIAYSNPSAYSNGNSSSSSSSSSFKPNIAGWLPVKDRAGLRDCAKIAVGGAYYAHGMLMLSGKTGANQPDSIVGISEDLLRRSDKTNKYGEPPSLREVVTSVGQMQAGSRTGGLWSKVYDIKEACNFIHSDRAALLRALCTMSATPVPTEVKDKPIHAFKTKLQPKSTDESPDIPNISCPITYAAGVIGQSTRAVDFGICNSDMKNVAQFTELEQQYIPLSNQRQVICLTRAGIQTFRKLRPIDYLIKFLLTRKLSVSDETNGGGNSEISLFFTRYGEVKACAMCIEILSGIYDDVTLGGDPQLAAGVVSGSDKRTLREEAFRCLRIARFGGEPAVVNYQQQTQQSNSSSSASKDGRVAAGGGFTPNYVYSNVHNASFLVCSRIVRPIWLRPISENGKLATIWTLADQWLLSKTRSHLENLRVFLGDYFRNALQARIINATNTDVVSAPGSILDQLRTDFQDNQRRETSQLQIYTNEAMQREENSIHSLWRVVCRSIQALNLLDILSFVQFNLRVDVSWRDFENISFKALVTSGVVHDKVKKLVSSLIVRLNKSTDITVMRAVDHVVNRLTEECYLYFSAGDRYGFEATKLVESIDKLIEQHSKQGIQDSSYQFLRSAEAETELLTVLLLKASAYWRNLSNVRDTSVVATADQPFSELTVYTNALARFGDAGRLGLVKLCLAVAAHFQPIDVTANGLALVTSTQRDDIYNINSNSSNSSSNTSSRSVLSMASWERWLYHSGAELTPEARQIGLQSVHSCLLKNIAVQFDSLRGLNPDLGDSQRSSAGIVSSYRDLIKSIRLMVDEVLTSSVDSNLRIMLFTLLLERDERELLRIVPDVTTRDLEAFIQDKDVQYDYQLLCRYYRTHQLYIPATEHMRKLAHSFTNLDLSIRENCLQSALAAAQDAVAMSQYARGSGNSNSNSNSSSGYIGVTSAQESVGLNELLAAISDELVVIGFQKTALQLIKPLSGSNNSSSGAAATGPTSVALIVSNDKAQLLDVIDRLQNTLMDVSDIFNLAVTPYHLYELALRIIQFSELSDPQRVITLWKSLIYRMVPLNASTPECEQFLRDKRSNNIYFDKRNQVSHCQFEDTAVWTVQLETAFLDIAVQMLTIYAHGEDSIHPNDLYFPLQVIIEELEDIACALAAINYPLGKGWAARLCMKLRISTALIMSSYLSLLDKSVGQRPDKIVQVIASASFVILHWVNGAYSRSQITEVDRTELLRTARTGEFSNWLERIKRQANLMCGTSGTRLTAQKMERLHEAVVELDKAGKRLQEMIVVI